MRMNKLERRLETESDKLQDLVLKVITDNSLKLKLRVKRMLINLVKNGEPKIRKVNPIDLLEPRCLSIFSQEKPEKVQEIGDDIILHSFKNNRLILFISF